VLGKPGPLSDAEFDLMKRHPDHGVRILANLPELERIVPIRAVSAAVRHHHERFDGHEYPAGLADVVGAGIPDRGRGVRSPAQAARSPVRRSPDLARVFGRARDPRTGGRGRPGSILPPLRRHDRAPDPGPGRGGLAEQTRCLPPEPGGRGLEGARGDPVRDPAPRGGGTGGDRAAGPGGRGAVSKAGWRPRPVPVHRADLARGPEKARPAHSRHRAGRQERLREVSEPARRAYAAILSGHGPDLPDAIAELVRYGLVRTLEDAPGKGPP